MDQIATAFPANFEPVNLQPATYQVGCTSGLDTPAPSPALTAFGDFRYASAPSPTPAAAPAAAPVPAPAPPVAGSMIDPGNAATMMVPASVLAAEVAAARAEERAIAAGRNRTWIALVTAFALLVLVGAGVVVFGFRDARSSSGDASHVGALSSGAADRDNTTILGATITLPAQAVPATSITPRPVATVPVATVPPVNGPRPTPPPTVPTTPPLTTPATTAPTTSTTMPAPALQIVNVTAPAQVGCFNPPVPSAAIPISWNVAGAVKVTISVDGPAVTFESTAAAGSTQLYFVCPGPHTYLVTAYDSANHSVTQTLTVKRVPD